MWLIGWLNEFYDFLIKITVWAIWIILKLAKPLFLKSELNRSDKTLYFSESVYL